MMNYLRNTICFILLSTMLFACNENSIKEDIKEFSNVPKSIDFNDLSSKGIFVLNQQQLSPDENGIIGEIKLELPEFQRGVYYRPFSEKSAAGNRVEPVWFEQVSQLFNYENKGSREDNFMNLGAFLMLEDEESKYVALLPLVSNHIGNTFSIKEEGIYLTIATYGTRTEDVSAPLIAYAKSESPYEAARLVWEIAMNTGQVKENINWRSNKKYPEAYTYLGWCSWEHYKRNISEEIILNVIADIKSSPIPFRWILIDDGYLDMKDGQLLSFGVDKSKFPNGWIPIASQKDDKIKWMGIWRNFNGFMQGVALDHKMPHLQEHLVRTENWNKERYMPQISPESANAFYNEMTADTKNNGFDIIKVDFQSDNFRYNTGSVNAILGVHYNNIALEENCKNKGLQLLNCIAMQNFNVFNHKYSCLIRGSVDYKTTRDRLDVTLIQNFFNAFWLGHTHWIDQDMFFANFKETARLMAVARAVSGGPIYLSDEPKNIDDTVLKPLTYSDGRILGTLAPAVPLPESLMKDPGFSGNAFRVIAPLENNTAVILAVNLNFDDSDVKSFISIKDYQYAGGMIQPYEGLWKVPKEGILLYNQYENSATVLNDEFEFELGSRKERLFQLSPILEGWSIIGQPDKYLSAAAFKLLQIDQKTIKIRMNEDGPLMLWSGSKVPQSDNFEFTKLPNGLWRGELKKAYTNKEYTIVAL